MFLSIFVPIVVFSIYVFRHSFGLGFGGDDYLALLDYFRGTGRDSLFNLDFFLWQYGPQDTLFGGMYHLFGLNPMPFFVLSFMLRMFAVASIYPLLRKITNYKLPVFMSMLFLATAFAGLETTSWSFNMAAYLVIVLLNLLILTLIRASKEQTLHISLLSVVLFFIIIILSPTRMLGLVPFVIFYQAALLLICRKINLTYFFGFPLAFLTILAIGNSVVTGNGLVERVNILVHERTAETSVGAMDIHNSGNNEVFLYPVEQLGAIIVPSSSTGQFSSYFFQTKRGVLVYSLFLSVLTMALINGFTTFQARHRVFLLLPSVVSIYFLKTRNIFINDIHFVWFTAGTAFTIIIFCLAISSYKKSKTTSLLVLTAFSWTAGSIFVFWNRFPDSVNITYHRYLIAPVVGVAILLGIIVSSGKSPAKRMFLALAVLWLILLNTNQTQQYLKNLYNNRNSTLTKSITDTYPSVSPLLDTNKQPLVFYFQSNNPEVLYHNVLFGFPAIVAIREKLDIFPNLVYTDSWEEVKNDYLDGSGLKRFSYSESPVPLENIFSYYLDSNILIDTTSETRMKLQK